MKIPRTIWLLLLAGLLIRLPFLPMIGFEQDFLFLTSWAEYLAKSSPVTIYADYEQLSVQFVNYPPVYLYILTGLARGYRAFSAEPFYHTAFLTLVKSATIAFELLTAFALYFWCARRWNCKTGAWAFGLYFLNPAILYVSAYYGQLDAIFSAFLLLCLIALSEKRFFWSGCSLAAALLIKIQTLPFIPLFFGLLLLRRQIRPFIWMAMGFLTTGAILLAPYLITGQMEALITECILRSFEWGKFVSVGAFNLWYLHADPTTFDERIWGIFFDNDGILQTNALIRLLTYKNLGVALFGGAFLLTLYGFWKRREENSPWIAAAHIALAFFMLPTKVHERYLFPYFVFAAPLAAQSKIRRFFFGAFSVTYLINLIVICPLIGESIDVSRIDSSWGVAASFFNLILYATFLAYEYALPHFPKQPFRMMVKSVGAALLCAIAILFWRIHARQIDPNVLYLSQLTPVSVEQDWPPIPPEVRGRPQTGYGQLKADLSSDGRQIQIGRTVFRYGLGAHAISRVEYDVPGHYQIFECYVGMDAEALDKYRETPDVATATFTVWVNGVHMLLTPLMLPTTPPRKISIPLTENPNGANRITLVVDGTADGIDSDHADWAMARVVRITPLAP
ncbi:MAG: NPCBM/NEW2 domain-containing protein [Candidatus Omnitrophica bacterium]|nr:NPCBM/NEW2 domain-containing protein [Candidatus Omnitrophota bacterium]